MPDAGPPFLWLCAATASAATALPDKELLLNRRLAFVSLAMVPAILARGSGLGLASPVALYGPSVDTPAPTITLSPAAWLPLVLRAQATAAGTPTPTPTATSTPTVPETWLAHVNLLRSLAKLPPVTENPTWS